MKSLFESTPMKIISSIAIFCFLTLQITAFLPADAMADSGKELKNIEYKYYFRGNYGKAISEFRAFLKKNDLTKNQIVEAREFLAASLVLSGASDQGKAQYVELLKMDGSYKGPDAAVFKPVIIATYDQARSEFASAVIRTVPDTPAAPTSTASLEPTSEDNGKPMYKKWWFYATMGAVVLVVAGAAGGGGGGDSAPPRDKGTVTVEVAIP